MFFSFFTSETSQGSSNPYNFLVNKEVNCKSSAYIDKSEADTSMARHINSN